MLLRWTLFLVAVSSLAAAPAVEGEWPRWRGPFDNGVARGDAPTRWSDTENIAWKADVPGRGHSSPVIWGDRLFLTTAVATGKAAEGGETQPEQAFLVMAFDRKTGKKLWERTAAQEAPHEGYHDSYGSFASNSPVTDGETLIAFFGSRGVYAYDLDGKLLWKKDFPPMRMRMGFGEGTAPVLHGSTLLLTFDHEGEDYMVALDKSTGEQIWRVDRDQPSGWAAPLVIEHGGKTQAIVAAPSTVISYELATGKILWQCSGLGLNTIPAPVYDGRRVFVMSGFRNPNLLAIDLDKAEGDITGSAAVLWTNQRGNSYTPSPVLQDGILYMLTDSGMLSALNAETGEPYYAQQRLPKPYRFKSSLVAANGKLYMASEDGDVVIVKMGKEYEVIATNTIADEFFIATPAIAEGEIYLRGKNTLYCIR
ncbi:MAG: PQQ-binding-like beta-propeller repeat protein [Acidobacteria bacterium]|nr:PQQ-binding-like beta-propeller repeat protein [Acidobacteriota bacterium]